MPVNNHHHENLQLHFPSSSNSGFDSMIRFYAISHRRSDSEGKKSTRRLCINDVGGVKATMTRSRHLNHWCSRYQACLNKIATQAQPPNQSSWRSRRLRPQARRQAPPIGLDSDISFVVGSCTFQSLWVCRLNSPADMSSLSWRQLVLAGGEARDRNHLSSPRSYAGLAGFRFEGCMSTVNSMA